MNDETTKYSEDRSVTPNQDALVQSVLNDLKEQGYRIVKLVDLVERVDGVNETVYFIEQEL